MKTKVAKQNAIENGEEEINAIEGEEERG